MRALAALLFLAAAPAAAQINIDTGWSQTNATGTLRLQAKSDGTLLQYAPSDGYALPWNQVFASFANSGGGQPDAVMRLGWNTAAGAGPINGSLPGGFDSWERHWEQTPGQFQYERHIQWRDTASVEHRGLSFEGFENTNTTLMAIFADQMLIGIGHDLNGVSVLNIQSGTTTIRDPAGTRGSLVLDDNGAQATTLQNTDGTHTSTLVLGKTGAANLSGSNAQVVCITHSGIVGSNGCELYADSTNTILASGDGSAQVAATNGGGLGFTVSGTQYAFFQASQFFVSQKLVYQQHDSLTTTTTGQQGLLLRNTTSATGGATQQYSPDFTQTGYGWTGSVNRAVSFKELAEPDGTGAGKKAWLYSSDENNYAEVMSITSAGVFSGAVFKTTTASVTTGGGGSTASFAASSVGGTGQPTTATQNSWIKMQDSTGATVWVPVWK